MIAQVVTANRLNDGEVVYLAEDGVWAERIEAAHVAHDAPEAEALLGLAERPEQGLAIVGPYLMAVAQADGRVEPLGRRERIRALGPSVRRDLGKQAVQA